MRLFLIEKGFTTKMSIAHSVSSLLTLNCSSEFAEHHELKRICCRIAFKNGFTCSSEAVSSQDMFFGSALSALRTYLAFTCSAQDASVAGMQCKSGMLLKTRV